MSRQSPNRSGGFTLVELLVVVTIIGMLAALSLGALQMARQAAREAKTKSLIAKLDRVVIERYESYRTRRVPINTSGMQDTRLAAQARLLALRDIMRMEMPERWSDVTAGPVAVDPRSVAPIPRPSLSEAYLRRYVQSRRVAEATYGVGTNRGEGTERINRYSSAECLYMIVAMGGGPDARDQFHESEIGDADADGLLEFHDGWGNPVLFLRWAPGVTESDVQAQTYFPDPSNPDTYLQAAAAVQAAALEDHDPFDPRNFYNYAYRLVPFIYSAGPDGIYDINFEGGYASTDQLDPFLFGPVGSPNPNEAGLPVDSINESVTAMDPPGPPDPSAGPKITPNSLDHFDNIHNHRIEAD